MEHSYTEECQQLLKLSPSCSGWLRTKNAVHKYGDAVGKNIPRLSDVSTKIVKIIPWAKHFVILFDKVIYVFKDETSRKPERRIRLTNFQGVEALTSDVKEVPWPFRLMKKDGLEEVFAAMSQDEQQKWLKAFEEYLDENNDESDNDYEDPIEYPTARKSQNSECANGKSPRGPLPAIPVNGADICQPSTGDYDNPEDDNSNGCSQNNLRFNNSRCNNFNNRNEKPYKKSGDGNSGLIKQPGQFVPVLPFGKQDKVLKKPAPCPSVDPDRSTAVRKCPNLVSSVSQKDALPNMTKKSPPLPPVAPKPTMKISPQPQKPIQVETAEVYAGDHLPYELVDLTTKAMWNGLPAEATSIMSKLTHHEGAFLLRVASQGSGYTLHVVCEKSSKKFMIKEEKDEFAMGGKTFKSIEDLLLHFKDNSLPSNDVRLGKPYSELC